jgi:hypothetical protein
MYAYVYVHDESKIPPIAGPSMALSLLNLLVDNNPMIS